MKTDFKNGIKEDKIMAMEINESLPDYAIRKQNYNSYAMQNIAESSTGNNAEQNGERKKIVHYLVNQTV